MGEEGEVWGSPRQQIAYNIVKEVDGRVPMRNGLDLAANVYRPEEAGEYPVIMGFTPYGKDIYWGDGRV
ncbi:hypothetical protein [Halobellus rufus]|uniref:hypothetical protein n=1 Tax=Halobellus rufus TaxID=1448860 RepID=UPI001E4F577B|nr:hypothetical protein [Halobellus rufus]